MIDPDPPFGFHLCMQNLCIASASVCIAAVMTLQCFLDSTGNPIDFSDKTAQLQWALDSVFGAEGEGSIESGDAFVATLMLVENALRTLGIVCLAIAAVHYVFASRLLDKLQTTGHSGEAP